MTPPILSLNTQTQTTHPSRCAARCGLRLKPQVASGEQLDLSAAAPNTNKKTIELLRKQLDGANNLDYAQRLEMQREIALREAVAATAGERKREGQHVTQMHGKLASDQHEFDVHKSEYDAARVSRSWEGEMLRDMRKVAMKYVNQADYLPALKRNFSLMHDHRRLHDQQFSQSKTYEELKEAHRVKMKLAEDQKIRLLPRVLVLRLNRHLPVQSREVRSHSGSTEVFNILYLRLEKNSG